MTLWLPRIYVRLRREGWQVNHKKVERLYYRDEGLSLQRRRRKKAAAVPRVALPKPTQPGRCYAMDFVDDRLANGRRFKCLTMTDPCSKEVPVIEVDVSIGGARVPDSRPAVRHASAAGHLDLRQRARIRRVGLRCLGGVARRATALHSAREAGAECVIESFNGKFRDECLNEHWFLTLQEAQLVIEAWRREYNEERTHCTIGDMTPMEFIHNHQDLARIAQDVTFTGCDVINGGRSSTAENLSDPSWDQWQIERMNCILNEAIINR